MLCIYANFTCPPPIITVKPKAKFRFHEVAILLIYIQQENYPNKNLIFFEAPIGLPYIISGS
jgi:hypothetical protein